MSASHMVHISKHKTIERAYSRHIVPRSGLKRRGVIMSLLDRLFPKPPIEKLMAKVNNIPYVNKGGCAIVAHAGYQYAKQQGMDAAILFGFGDNIEEADFLQKGVPVTCGHAVLKVNDLYIDSTGSWESFFDLCNHYPRYAFFEVHPDLCYKAIQNPQGGYAWNPSFDREIYAPKIARIFRSSYQY